MYNIPALLNQLAASVVARSNTKLEAQLNLILTQCLCLYLRAFIAKIVFAFTVLAESGYTVNHPRSSNEKDKGDNTHRYII